MSHRRAALMSVPLVRAVAALRPNPWRCLLAVAAGVGALGAAIALLGVSGWLITRAAQQPPVLYLMVAVVTVRALGLGRGVLRYAERLVGHDIALRGAVTLRTTLFERLGRAPGSIAAGYRRGDLLARLGTDVDDLADLVVRALLPCAVALITALAAVCALALILPLAAAVLAAGLIVAGVLAPALVAIAAMRAERSAAEAQAALAAEVLDVLETLPELTVAGAVTGRLEHQAQLERALATELDAAERPAAAGALVATLGTGGALLGTLIAGASATAGARLDPVLLAVVVLVALGAAETVSGLPTAAVALVRGRFAAARICALLDTAQEPVVPPSTPVPDGRPPSALASAPRKPHLWADGLSCGAPDQPAVLRDVRLDLAHGSRLAIVGASGSGKTTLLLTLAGLLPPLAGRVALVTERCAPLDLAAMPDDDARAAVTFVADDAHVFATTVRENLRLAAPDADDAAFVAALRRVALGPWLDGSAAGLDTRVGAASSGPTAVLSGGERRRLLLARAVLSDSGVLLLDEPAEHLDTVASDALVASVLARGEASLAGDRTVLVVTHRLAPLAAADEVVVLAQGGVAARGTHEELLSTFEPYRRAYELENVAMAVS